ncbi:MAG: hypothetical protein ACFB4J_17030 [Elainellaceae cyanobacterium]
MLGTNRRLFRQACRVIGDGTIWLALLLAVRLSAKAAIAQTLPQEVLEIAAPPLEVDLLQPDADLSDRAVVTRDTVQASELTLPSLWWADQQYGGKLLEDWIAYPSETTAARRVDLVVNRQLWGLYTYLERYQFVRRLGITALQFGYSTRVFNRQGAFLGAYWCEDLGADNAALPVDTTQPDTTQPDTTQPDSLEPNLLGPNLQQLNCQVYLDSPGIAPPRGRFSF